MPVLASRPPIAASGATTVSQWNLDGSTSTNVFVSVVVPPGYVWDGSFLNVKVTIDTQIDSRRILLAIPIVATLVGNSVRVQVLVVVASRSNWASLSEYSPVNALAEVRLIPDPAGGSAEFKKRLEVQWLN